VQPARSAMTRELMEAVDTTPYAYFFATLIRCGTRPRSQDPEPPPPRQPHLRGCTGCPCARHLRIPALNNLSFG
jgi:hypothetical protein